MTMNLESSWGLFKRLLQYALPYRLAFGLACLGNLIYAAADSIFVKYFSSLVDYGLVKRDGNFIVWIPIFIIGYFFTRGIASCMASYFMGLVGRSVVKDFRKKMLDWLLLVPASYYHSNASSNLISKINYDTEQIAETISNAVMSSIRGVFITFGLVTIMFITNWRLTILLLAALPVLVIYINHVSGKMRKHSMDIQNTMGQITHVAREITEGFPVIRAFGGHSYEKARIERITKDNFNYEMKMVRTVAISVPIMQCILALAVAMLLYLATLPASHPLGTGMSAGEFSSMLFAMLQLLRPVKQIAMVNSVMQRGIAAVDSILSLLDMPIERDIGKKVLTSVKGYISFNNLSFRYQDDGPWVLKDINLSVSPGQTIAIVGSSGGGKTTLLSLLPRFYDYSKGEITLDGHSLDSLTLDSLRKQFAIVSQNVILFNDTILNNIAYGCKQNSSLEDIITASKLANADEFICELSDGYKTVVGDNGIKLSGGQRQRIAIARAILKNAPFLILDEATASLDSESEQKIEQAMLELRSRRTTFIIAHRLSTIQQADQIVVIENGEILESGTHEELLAVKKRYYKLWNAQYKTEQQTTISYS